jgi:hypothetical protein
VRDLGCEGCLLSTSPRLAGKGGNALVVKTSAAKSRNRSVGVRRLPSFSSSPGCALVGAANQSQQSISA